MLATHLTQNVRNIHWQQIGGKHDRLSQIFSAIPTTEHIDDFKKDSSLGRNLLVTFAIKKAHGNSGNQLHLEDGFLLRTSLDGDSIYGKYGKPCRCKPLIPIRNPRGIAIFNNELIVTGSDRITIFDSSSLAKKREFTHSQGWYSELHDLAISPDRRRCLFASTGTASIFEIDICSGIETYRWTPWERNRSYYSLFEPNDRQLCIDANERVVIKGKGLSGREYCDYLGSSGFSPASLPFHFNGIEYGNENNYFFNLGFQGEIWDVREGLEKVVIKGLSTPHGFKRDSLFGYRVVNTESDFSNSQRSLHSSVMFFNQNLQPLHMIDFHPKLSEATSYKQDWFQNVISIDNGTMYIAIDPTLSRIVIFDIGNGTYRDIQYPGYLGSSWSWRPHDCVIH